jgi:hypothetical protein
MTEYTLLEDVTARQEGRVLRFPPQPRTLLARLIWAAGAPVPVPDLAHAIGAKSETVKSVVFKLRGALEDDGLPAAEIVTIDAGRYQLPLERERVDVFRFSDKLDAAKDVPGPERARLVREALAEWGPRAHGLFGGQPLSVLESRWSRAARRQLQVQYRDAVIDSLRWRAEAGDRESVLKECERVAVGDLQNCMKDDEFLKLLISAAHQSGQPERATRLLNRAAEPGKPVSPELRGRFDRLQEQVVAVGQPSSRTAAPPAYPDLASSKGKEMSKNEINFNNYSDSKVGNQIGNAELIIFDGRDGGAAVGLDPVITGAVAADTGDTVYEPDGDPDE